MTALGTTLPEYQKTIDRQTAAARPDLSVWVAANAGAGKTKVLTDRVVRLLLSGVLPTKILSITFTKAAAAEMADRLFGRLGDWALYDDETLSQKLKELDEGADISAVGLTKARQLFAAALETPGGLKIQTIHSFCESVLRRFPIEAGIYPGFTVMEEMDASALVDEAVDTMASGVGDNKEQYTDFITLTSEMTTQTLKQELIILTQKAREVEAAIGKAGSLETLLAELAKVLEIHPEKSPSEDIDDYIELLDTSYLSGVESAMAASVTATDKKFAVILRSALAQPKPEDCFEGLRSFFFISKDADRKNMTCAGARKILPNIEERLKDMQEVYRTVFMTMRVKETYLRTCSLYRLARSIWMQYNKWKLGRGLLDFNDLIEKTATLFQATSADWVLYKLDQGIDHILVDEAQDTSEGQWRVIEGPLAEFFSGLNARADRQLEEIPPRTVFVVGDEKQSIYSFQGANVDLFQTKKSSLSDQVQQTGHEYTQLGLDLSFRSARPILHYVDEIFTQADVAKGVVEGGDMKHTAFRQEAAGLVEHWPLIPREKSEKQQAWDKPVDALAAQSPVRKLAKHIALTIKGWLENKEKLISKDRPIKAGDIMLLFQSRNSLFHEVVRELTIQNVPTSGADRIKLLEDTGVRDMLAALRFALQTDDNLSLAEVLKSPLYNFSEEELFDVAHGRAKNISLWKALRLAGEGDTKAAQKCAGAAKELAAARSIGALRGPYAFFSHLLEGGACSGWARMYQRLGHGVEEPLQELLSEALNFDISRPRSLQLFLAYFEGLTKELKKEAGGNEDLVRCMTVHGSKGLEANIVFLVDAGHQPRSRDRFLQAGPIVQEEPNTIMPHPGLFLRKESSDHDTQSVAVMRAYAERLQAEEKRRLLYVAATRARDRLYICGTLGGSDVATPLKKDPAAASWHTLSYWAMMRLQETGAAQVVGQAEWGGDIIRLETDQQGAFEKSDQEKASVQYEPPSWINDPLPPEKAQKRLSPSRLMLEEQPIIDAEGELLSLPQPAEPAAAPPIRLPEGFTPYTRGNALHLLLEKLPDLPMADRQAAAQIILAKEVPALSAELITEWSAEVMTVLEDPAFAEVFAPGSRPEVSVAGQLPDGTMLSGQIDRLVVTETKVLIVDYKTNRPPPLEVKNTAPAYIRQLAAYRALLAQIYPHHVIETALLWTFAARLMPVPAEMLDHAFVQSGMV